MDDQDDEDNEDDMDDYLNQEMSGMLTIINFLIIIYR
jgi:hypothetical protein